MKLNLKGIRFSVWRYLFFFALGIVFMLGILQIAFIRPYYRNSKVQTINHVATLIQSYIIDNNTLSEEDLQNSIIMYVQSSIMIKERLYMRLTHLEQAVFLRKK